MNSIENDFGLPKISEDLDKEEFDYRNKYRNIYLRIIIRCQNMTEEELSGYNEKHHILPKCLGGGNEKENLVLMPVRYHIIAHMVLARAYQINKLWYAVHSMLSLGNSQRKIIKEKYFSTKKLAKLREEIIINISGIHNPNYGIIRSEEFKEKIRKANIGKKASKETKIKMSLSRSGSNNWLYNKPFPEEAKRKLSEKMKGRKLTEEQRKLWSEVKLGKKNANYGKHLSNEHKQILSDKTKEAWKRGDFEKYKDKLNQKRGKSWCAKKVVGPDGTIYDCLLDAVEVSGIPNSTLRGWMKKGPEGKNGWHYLNPIDSLKLKDKKELLNKNKSQSD